MRLELGARALRALLLALLSGVLCLKATAQSTPQQILTLSFSTQAVQAQGITPSSTVIWFGVGRDVQEYAAVQSLVPQVGTADGQGQATLTLPGPVPPLSIWIAVDYQTGAYALGRHRPIFPSSRRPSILPP